MLQPLNGGLLVKRLYPKKRGMIITPSLGRNETVLGKVIAKSDDYIQDGVVRKVFVEIGDIVVYNQIAELPFRIGEKNEILVYITNVIAVISGQDGDFTEDDPNVRKD